MAEPEMTERWSTYYVVRGIAGPVVLGAALWLALQYVAPAIALIPASLLVSLGSGPLALVLTAGGWATYAAPFVAGACVLFGLVRTLVGGVRREYRATPGRLTFRHGAFSRTSWIDVDSITRVEVHRGILGRLFRGGTLRITTKAGPVKLRWVADPDLWAAFLRPAR